MPATPVFFYFDLGNVLLRWDPRFLFRTIFADPARREALKTRIAPHYTCVDIPRCAAEQWPRLALAGLNPHAGEAGLFGSEESDTIEPALKALRKELGASCKITGPLPADTLFANHILARQASARKRGSVSDRVAYDAVICMYHDQGLIPVKLLDFQKTVNVTLGLPIVRTSVDHGVAFDIAGKGIADPSSLESALRLAAEIVRKRRTLEGE